MVKTYRIPLRDCHALIRVTTKRRYVALRDDAGGLVADVAHFVRISSIDHLCRAGDRVYARNADREWVPVLTVRERKLDDLVRRHTAVATLDELVGKAGTYCASIYTKGNRDKRMLADAYDARMAELGRLNRAYRG